MTQAQEIFLQKKTLRDKAAATVNASWFQEFMTYAKAHAMETQSMSKDEQDGIRKFTQAMLGVTQEDSPEVPALKSGLHHDLSVDRTKAKKSQTAEEKGKE